MNNTTPKVNVRAGNEAYNGKTEEELRTLLDEKKAELEAVQLPDNQQGMPAYHGERAGIFTAMARIYRKLVMTEAADLADISAKTETKAAAQWNKNLSGWSEVEGGGKKRRFTLRKSVRRRARKYSRINRF